MATLAVLLSFVFLAGFTDAQREGQLESEVFGLEGQMSSAERDQAVAELVISRLDVAESSFARLTSSGKVDNGVLVPLYHQIEAMLARMETVYSDKKKACIETVDHGRQCDRSNSEELALHAAYPLAWLRFTAATTLFAYNAEQSKELLNESKDGFSASMRATSDPNLIRKNWLGRAYCERELGRFDHAEYDYAIADFKKIMSAGPGTQQYIPAREGLFTIYAKLGVALPTR
jgi:hypothetical protein